MNDQPVRIIQLSDTHLLEDTQGSLLGVKTEESFQAVLQALKKESCDLLLHSGDLSQDGSAATYIRLAKALSALQVPIYSVPGNHDNAKEMARVFPCENMSNHRHVVLKDWHLILLNSQVPSAVEGYLDRSQLHYLEHCLQIYPEHQALILFHHHPFALNTSWLDPLGLKNADELWKLVANYPKVKVILFGHVHMETERKLNGIVCYSTPSTCIQFKQNQSVFGLEKLPPGYRVIELFPDGQIKTEVKRIDHYVGHFDEKAQGY